MRPFLVQQYTTIWSRDSLLDLGFFELDVLANDGIILPESQLFRLVTGIFLSDIKKSGVSGAEQFDLYSGWLRHDTFLQAIDKIKGGSAAPPQTPRGSASLTDKCQVASADCYYRAPSFTVC